MNEDAAQEFEALASILGADMWVDVPGRRFVLCVTPEHDTASECAGAAALVVTLPSGYPGTEPVSIEARPFSEHSARFQHPGSAREGVSWEDVPPELLQPVVASATDGRLGEPVVFDAVDAVRQWLSEHTVRARPTPADADADALSRTLAEADVSEEDIELDEEDMDEEMIEAIREIESVGPAIRTALDRAERLSGDKMRKVLHAIWLQLTPAQRREMVADSDFSDVSESDEESYEDAPPPQTRGKGTTPPTRSKGASGGDRGGKDDGAAACPPPARRACPRGHTLTPSTAKPEDYKKLDGNTGVCDGESPTRPPRSAPLVWAHAKRSAQGSLPHHVGAIGDNRTCVQPARPPPLAFSRFSLQSRLQVQVRWVPLYHVQELGLLRGVRRKGGRRRLIRRREKLRGKQARKAEGLTLRDSSPTEHAAPHAHRAWAWVYNDGAPRDAPHTPHAQMQCARCEIGTHRPPERRGAQRPHPEPEPPGSCAQGGARSTCARASVYEVGSLFLSTSALS